MADVIIVGDGPGGLSAALLLAKCDADVVLFGQDKTAMHAAMLYNYIGIEAMTGSDFQKIARAQVVKQGATVRDERVEAVEFADGQFTASTESGETVTTRYVILSEGKSKRLAESLGAAITEAGAVSVDINGLTSVDKLYAIGRSTRPGRSQAIISAGDGAAAAIDILSRERGQDFCDWDVPE